MTGTLYAPADALKDRLGISENDSREGSLIEVLDAASRWVEKETARRFYVVASEVRYYTVERNNVGTVWNWERPGGGWSPQQLVIDDAVAVTAVETDEDGDGVYERTWTVNTDYWLGPRNATALGKPYRQLHRNQAVGRYMFPAYENAIKVTGSFGYSSATPADIRDLTLSMAELLARPLLDLTIAGAATYKLGAELTVTMASSDLTPSAKRIIENYRDAVFL